MLEMLSIVDLRFLLMVLLGSVAGLFVGAIPGLSVSMATALLVSITYTWDHSDALAMIMGVYVDGRIQPVYSVLLEGDRSLCIQPLIESAHSGSPLPAASGFGFAWNNQHLHPSTDYSVSPRRCHDSVSTSLLKVVPEY